MPGDEHCVASAFLADVFSPSTEAPVFLTSLPNPETKDHEPPERHLVTRGIDVVEAFIRKWDRPGRALYFCTATIKPGLGQRTKETLCELNGLHVDLDFKSLENSREEIDRALQSIEMLPSNVVASGNGLHAYWLFKEALEATPENIAYVEDLLRRLTGYLGGDPACAEASRLMRLPGSHNSKGGAWIPVEVVTNRSPLRYEPCELEDWLANCGAPRLRRKAAEVNGQTANPWLIVANRFGAKPPIDVESRLAAMRYRGAGETGIHATQLQVSASLLNHGLPEDEIVVLLLEATRAAAGPYGASWDWPKEEKNLRDMCATWRAKRGREEQENGTEELPEPAPSEEPAPAQDRSRPKKARSQKAGGHLDNLDQVMNFLLPLTAGIFCRDGMHCAAIIAAAPPSKRTQMSAIRAPLPTKTFRSCRNGCKAKASRGSARKRSIRPFNCLLKKTPFIPCRTISTRSNGTAQKGLQHGSPNILAPKSRTTRRRSAKCFL